jgi:hypothetical protein
MLTRVELEYSFRCPTKIVFDRLAFASGLAEWYADDVIVSNNLFTFVWDDDYQEDYRLISRKQNKYVNFVRTDDDEACLDFNLSQDEFSGNVLLNIAIDVEDDDIEDIETHFENSIDKLKRIIGAF